MTVRVTLPSSPGTVEATHIACSSKNEADLAAVIHAIVEADELVVVSGAGVSVAAGIPDFRSPSGLFQSLKRQYRGCGITSGKDLFDRAVFATPASTQMFFTMMGTLSLESQAALPTPFHRLLRTLDLHKKLLRVYTQNIDGLESKAGLSHGVPDDIPAPRCIPLHGNLNQLRCRKNGAHVAVMGDYAHILARGEPPECDQCTRDREHKQQIGKRCLGPWPGLSPDVLLYGEFNTHAQSLHTLVCGDLERLGNSDSGIRLLLVVGTRLDVPGAQQLVGNFMEALHQDTGERVLASTGTPIRSIYINLEGSVAKLCQKGHVFDVWLHGDLQVLAESLLLRLEHTDDVPTAPSQKQHGSDAKSDTRAVKVMRNRTAPTRSATKDVISGSIGPAIAARGITKETDLRILPGSGGGIPADSMQVDLPSEFGNTTVSAKARALAPAFRMKETDRGQGKAAGKQVVRHPKMPDPSHNEDVDMDDTTHEGGSPGQDAPPARAKSGENERLKAAVDSLEEEVRRATKSQEQLSQVITEFFERSRDLAGDLQSTEEVVSSKLIQSVRGAVTMAEAMPIPFKSEYEACCQRIIKHRQDHDARRRAHEERREQRKLRRAKNEKETRD